MAREIELSNIDGPSGTVSARVASAESSHGYKSPFVFEPMRRKMRLEPRIGVETNGVIEQ